MVSLTPDQIAAWLASLIERVGLRAVLAALFRTVSPRQVLAVTYELCRDRFGDEPLVEGGWYGDSPRASSGLLPSPPANNGQDVIIPFKYQRCYFHEPYMGRQDPKCLELARFEPLEDDLKEQYNQLLQEEALHGSNPEARRSARYFLYRKYVFEVHGKLGARVRIRIPTCVVEYIRAHFRQPGCDCKVGGDLYNCIRHGYVGHQDTTEPD